MLSRLLIPLLALCVLRVCSQSGCDPGWSGDATLGACYLLGPLSDGVTGTLMNWGDAYTYCLSIRPGAFLATIKTQVMELRY